MRLNPGILWMACATFALARPLTEADGQQNGPIRPNGGVKLARFEKQAPGDEQTAASPAASSGQKDTRLTLKDIWRLREQRVAPERIIEKVAEQGRAFDVTAEAAEELRVQGFSPVQIDAIRESSPDPLVPGKWLTTNGKQRDRVFESLKRIAAKSEVDIEPIQSQHVTLWAARGTQQMYLAALEDVEKFFHTKCAEPIRSGLDKRSAHIILLKDHAEYKAWLRAMFDLSPNRKAAANAYRLEEAIKGSAWYSSSSVSICMEDMSVAQVHHKVAAGVANMYFSQLAEPRRDGPLQTGFINRSEAAVFNSPTVMFHIVDYGIETSNPANDSQDWNLLVRHRMITKKVTPLHELLQMDTTKMWQAHYAEGWTLVELLASQPTKFGKLLLALRKSDSELAAIEKVYGWDEKRLTKEWRAYVMAHRAKAKK